MLNIKNKDYGPLVGNVVVIVLEQPGYSSKSSCRGTLRPLHYIISSGETMHASIPVWEGKGASCSWAAFECLSTWGSFDCSPFALLWVCLIARYKDVVVTPQNRCENAWLPIGGAEIDPSFPFGADSLTSLPVLAFVLTLCYLFTHCVSLIVT